MDLGTARAAVDLALSGSGRGQEEPLVVDLYGGEPLLVGDKLWEIVEGARSAGRQRGRRVRFELTTNGTLITRETARMLRQMEISVGVSLDGPARVHDRHRVYPTGAGSFRDAVRGIEHLLAEGVPGLTVRATLSRPFPRVEEILSTLAMLGAPNLELELATGDVAEIGLCGAQRLTNSDCESEARRDLYRCFVEWLAEKNRVIDVRTARRVSGLMNSPHVDVPCGAGTAILAVTPDGRAYPCLRFAAMDSTCLGDVQEGLKRERLLGFDQCYPSAIEGCQACWARYMCERVCPAISAETGGNLLHQPREACEAYLESLQLSFWAICELKEKAPGILEKILAG
jgi:uncharacterized protein